MPVYIDPPRWPAHGTVFSHLVSDTSLEELHDLAQRVGLSRRAFDEDHYDVAEAFYDTAVAEGAIPVDGKELARRLVQSGLRIPAARRSEKSVFALKSRWDSTLGSDPELRAVRAELLERWGEAHRSYHDRTHLLAVLRALDLLTQDAPPQEVVLAAWFHDAVYEGRPRQDEEASAVLAEQLLTRAGCSAQLVEQTARLVRLTADHDPAPEDHAGRLLCDADLAVLGGTPVQYADYVRRVTREYASVPRTDFVRGRLQILEQLAQGAIYRLPQAEQLWGARAAENLAVEIAQLRAESLAERRVPAGLPVLTIVGVCLVRDGRLLTVRKRGTGKFMLVGGKVEPGESVQQAALREVAEEVGLDLEPRHLREIGRFESPAANEADTWIASTVFAVDPEGSALPEPQPLAEIEQLRWLDLAPAAVQEVREELAPLVRDQVIPVLRGGDRRFWTSLPQ